MPLFDTTIEYVIETHDDRDHIGGMESVLKKYKVNQYVSTEVHKSTEISKRLQDFISTHNIPRKRAVQGTIIQENEVVLHTLWPQQEYIQKYDFPEENGQNGKSNRDRSNARSLVFRLEFGGFSALLTGDLEIPEENAILSSGETVRAALLKIGHHGSNGSTSEVFLDAVRPMYAAISVGKNNQYKHPSPRVMQLLEHLNIYVSRTDRDGEVTYQTDGQRVWVKRRML